MTYNWESFYEFSKYLFDDLEYYKHDVDTKYRFIISKSYYAAYHVAKQFVKDNKLEVLSAGGEHERIVTFLLKANKGDAQFKTNCRRIGMILDRLKTNRHKADYKDNTSFSTKEVNDQLVKTKELIDNIRHMYS